MTFKADSVFHVDNDKARQIASEKADGIVAKSFPGGHMASDDAANKLWLQIFWQEFKRMVVHD